MAVLPIDSLETGMILHADVKDRSGRLLLPAGAELAEKHLRVFRTWGITEADVERTDDDESTESSDVPTDIDPLVLAAAEHDVDQLFLHNDPHHPMIRELRKICLERRLARGA